MELPGKTYQTGKLILNTVETEGNQLEVYVLFLEGDSIRQVNNINGIDSLLGLEGEPENSFDPFYIDTDQARNLADTFFEMSTELTQLIKNDLEEE